MKTFLTVLLLAGLTSCVSKRYALEEKGGDVKFLQNKIKELSSRDEISRKPIVVLDGIPWRYNQELKNKRLPLTASDIQEIHTLDKAGALQIYGDEASAGVVMITKKTNELTNKLIKSNVLILLDSKSITHEEMEKIDVNSIESIDVIKEKEKVCQYTTEPVEGVIIIHTRGRK